MNEFLSLLPGSGLERFAIDSLWQCAVIGAITFLFLRFIVRQSAAKAWLAFVAVLMCVATPVTTAYFRGMEWGLLEASVPQSHVPAVVSSSEHHHDNVQFAPNEPVVVDDSIASETLEAFDAHDVWLSEMEAATPAMVNRFAFSQKATKLAPSWSSIWMVCVFAWSVASVLLLVRLGRSAYAILRICRTARDCRDGEVLEASRRAAVLLQIPKPPPVLVTDRVSCPAVISWFWPRLIVPTDTKLGGQDFWISVLTHELAHVRRRDGWARLAIECATIVLPWHPTVWWLRDQYQQASEEACDDWAVFTGADPFDYATSLTSWIPQRQPALTLGIAGWPKVVQRRIERLLADCPRSKPAIGRACMLLTSALAVTMLVLLSLLQSAAPTLADDQTVDTVPPSSSDTDVLRESTNQSTSERLGSEQGFAIVGEWGDGRLCHWNAAEVLGFAVDSKTVISGGADRTLVIWETRNGQQRKSIELPPSVTGRWTSWNESLKSRYAADELLTSDGEELVLVMADGTIRIIELATGSSRVLDHHVLLPSKLTISADGTRIAILKVAADDEQQIDVVELASGHLINTITRRFTSKEDAIKPDRWRSMALSPDGSQLATGRSERVSLWGVTTGDLNWTVQAHQRKLNSGIPLIHQLAFSPRSANLVSWSTSSNGQGKLWNAKTGEELGSFDLPETLTSRSSAVDVAFNSSGTALAMAMKSSVQVWNVATGEVTWIAKSEFPTSRFSSVVFDHDGQRLAAGCGNEIVLFDAMTGQRVGPNTATNRVHSVAVNPVKNEVLIGMASGHISACALNTSEAITTWRAHDFPVDRILFSPDGRTAASSTANRVVLHDLDRARPRHTLPLEENRGYQPRSMIGVPLAFSGDGSRLLSFLFGIRSRNQLRCQSTKTGRLEPNLELANAMRSPYEIVVTPDDHLLAHSQENSDSLSMWDAVTGKHIKDLERIRPRFGGKMRFAVSRDGRKIAYGIQATAIRIHDRDTEAYVDLLKGHVGGSLRALAFHPGGHICASAAQDGTVSLWDCGTGKRVDSLTVGPSGGVINQLGWTNDGRALVTRNGNGTVYAIQIASLADSGSE